MNELNQLEQSRDKWNYAELFAETKGEVKIDRSITWAEINSVVSLI